MDSHYYVFSLYFYVILNVLQDVATCRYGSAPNCGFSCRCDGSETCDPNTGVCSGSNACGRDLPWHHRYEGVGCRIENLAYGKTATQGKTHRAHEANRAIDGNASSADSTCMAVYMPSITDKAWWMVNLGTAYTILGIYIYNNFNFKDCSYCNGACYQTTGCNTCAAGRKLPDCRYSCPYGYWGVNCNMTCGACTDNQTCNEVNGICSNGCADWYTNTYCTEYIESPNILSSALTIKVYDDHDILLTWDQYEVPDPILDRYYFYIIDYKTTTQNDASTTQEIAQDTTGSLSTNFTLGGLKTQTQYTVQIRVYRTFLGMTDEGIGPEPVTFDFHCTEPSRPVLTSDSKTERGWYNITFTPITLLNSGCSAIVTYDLHVMCTVADTRLEILSFQQDHHYTLDVRTKPNYAISTIIDMRCELWLTTTNSGNFTISSAITTMDTTETDTNDNANDDTFSHLSDMSTTVSNVNKTVSNYGLGPTSKNTSGELESGKDNSRISDTTISTALIVGCTVGAVGLLMLIIGVTMVVRNRQCCKKSSEKPDQEKVENVNINTSDQVYYNIANDGVKVSGPADTVEPTRKICSVVDKQDHYETMDSIKPNKNVVPAIYQTLS